MAADALALADALGWSRFHLLGHSMSGKVVQLLAMAAPSRLSSAIALTPTPPIALEFDAGTRALLESCETSLDSRKNALAAATGSQYGAGFVARLAELSVQASEPRAYRAYLDAWSRTDICDRLSGSEVPLEIVIGDKDPFVPEAAMRETLMPRFAKARLTVLSGLGHYPLIEAPPRTLALFETIFATRP